MQIINKINHFFFLPEEDEKISVGDMTFFYGCLFLIGIIGIAMWISYMNVFIK